MHHRLAAALAQGIATTALGIATMAAVAGKPADSTLYWSEISSQFVNPPPAYIKAGTGLGGLAPDLQAPVSGAANLRGPNGLEYVDGRLWWPDQQLGVIGSVDPNGGAVRKINAAGVYDMDVQGGKLYWSANNSGQIFVINNLAAPSPLSTVLMSGLNRPFAVDATAQYLYWSEVVGAPRLMRAGLDGSNATQLLSNVVSYDFEVTSQYIYLTTTDGQVLRTALDGSDRTVLATGLGFLNGIDVTDNAIYVSSLSSAYDGGGFTATGGGQVMAMGLDGSQRSVLYTAATGYVDPNQPWRADAVRGVAFVTSPVPEPATWALWGVGAAWLLSTGRRRLRTGNAPR